jgi:hypothetical protein
MSGVSGHIGERYDPAMRGVHRKREEPPRWTPTLAPIQERLSRRLSIFLTTYLAVGFLVNLAMNLLEPPSWVWWSVGTLGLIAFAAALLMMRALHKTGPPWWWPWRFPRTRTPR